MLKKFFNITVALMAVLFLLPMLAQGVSTSTQDKLDQCQELLSSYPQPQVKIEKTDKGIMVKWDKIGHPDLKGYKIVISKNNPNPRYDEDGYLQWITNKETTSYLIDNSVKYRGGDFGEYLKEGEEYYFSVTAVYECGKVAGNAVRAIFQSIKQNENNQCQNKLLVREGPTNDKYWEKLGLDTSKHSDILKYRIRWWKGTWSEWFIPGVNDIDWKDNCGDRYYLGGRRWDPTRPAECSRRVWSYFTDHQHEYYICLDGKSKEEVEEFKAKGEKFIDQLKKQKPIIKPYPPKVKKPYLLKQLDDKEIRKKARALKPDRMEDVLAELRELRSLVKEQQAQIRYLKRLTKELRQLADDMQAAIQNFVAYGVDENTKYLGEGERAAVIYSFKEAFGKLPSDETELEDVIRIANGRWPSKRSLKAEQKALERFQQVYKRLPDFSNSHDNAAITIMAYGLRQPAVNRNLRSEQKGLEIYRNIFGKLPETTEDWNVMQAITYSGAQR